MSHSIELWRTAISTAWNFLLLAKGAAAEEEELPPAEEGDLVLAELCRQYPTLPRELVEYLAR